MLLRLTDSGLKERFCILEAVTTAPFLKVQHPRVFSRINIVYIMYAQIQVLFYLYNSNCNETNTVINP